MGFDVKCKNTYNPKVYENIAIRIKTEKGLGSTIYLKPLVFEFCTQ